MKRLPSGPIWFGILVCFVAVTMAYVQGGVMCVTQQPGHVFAVGLSTDEKPTLPSGSCFFAKDTGTTHHYDGSKWTKVGGIAPLYELDFTQQTTQNLKANGNGTYSINGKSWYTSSTAAASTMDILNGTGMRMTRTGANQSPPRLEVTLAELAPNANQFRSKIFIWSRIINNSPLVQGHFIHIHYFNSGLGSLNHAFGPINEAGTQKVQIINDGTAFTYLRTTHNVTDDVYVAVIDDQFQASYYSGQWDEENEDWPAWSSLHGRGNATWTTPATANCNALYFNPGGTVNGNLSLGVAADDIAAGPSACSFTWTHLLIEGCTD